MKDNENGDKSNSLQVGIPIYPNIKNSNNLNMQETKTRLNNLSFASISFDDINLKNNEKKKNDNDLITVKKNVKENNNEIKIEGEEDEEKDEKENNLININSNLIENDDIKESQRLEDLLSEKDLNNDFIKEQNSNLFIDLKLKYLKLFMKNQYRFLIILIHKYFHILLY